MHKLKLGTLTPLLACITLGSACGSTRILRRTPLPAYSYESTEPNLESLGLTVAVVRGEQGSTHHNLDALSLCISDFNTGVEDALADLVVMKGATTRGPYQTRDDMTFLEKKGSDLILVSEVMTKLQVHANESTKLGRNVSPNSVHFASAGTVKLSIYEPLTYQKLWVKNVRIPSREGDAQLKFANRTNSRDEYDAELDYRCGLFLREAFKSLLPQLGNHLDLRELLELKAEAMKVRETKRF